MKKSIQNQEMPLHLQEWLGCKTYGEGEKELKSVNEILIKTKKLIREKSIDEAKKMKQQGKTIIQISNKLDISVSTVSRYLKL